MCGALFSCGIGKKNGGIIVFSAKKIGKTPYKEKRNITISQHTFTYYNVYSDDEGNFILKDETSYILNFDIVFGLKFNNHNGDVLLYDVSENKNEIIEPMDEGSDEYASYSVNNGFKIQINPEINSIRNDINLGLISHWC
mgnify:FL=1